MNQKVTMGNLLEVERVNAVEAVESNVFESRLLLQDGSEATLRLDGPTLAAWLTWFRNMPRPSPRHKNPNAAIMRRLGLIIATGLTTTL
jgi:hypothetical protein